MPPRRRDRQNDELPDNLHFTTRKKTGVRYYEYHHPTERTPSGRPVRHGMGSNKVEAIKAANQLNQMFEKGRALVDKVTNREPGSITLGEYIRRYRETILPSRRIKGHPLSQAYITELTRVLRVIEGHFGPDREMGKISQAEIADYLNSFESPEASNKHRAALAQLWKHAVSDGLVGENVPARILPRDKGMKVRQRLSLAHYKQIFPSATPATQMAMEISLNALQRRSDVKKWKRSDQWDGYAHIIQQKTRKHGPSAYLAIPLNLPVVFSGWGCSTLGEILDYRIADVICPFIVCQRPDRVRKSKEKGHPFQLSAKQISDGFAEARDASGLFDDLPPAERPTYHELLSLGEHLREQAGWTTKQIQQLRGHSTERMTEHYLEGHTWTVFEIPGEATR